MMTTSNVSLVSEVITDYLQYATSIYGRALPDIIDGLKVAQRRGILGMLDLNLKSSTPFCKVSRLEGHVLGKYHPQGGCSGTLINMGQQSTIRYAISDIHGNCGGSIQSGEFIGQMVSEDSPAAARYLEIRATDFCEKVFLSQIHHQAGDWRPNYDGSKEELVRIIPPLPALLLSGSSGIASGYACHHIPWNIKDVANASVALIKNPKISDKLLIKKFPNPPEPPPGGRIVKDSGLQEALLSGRGQITSFGNWDLVDALKWGKRSTRPALIVTRLAIGSSEKFLDRVRDLSESEKLPGLLDAADHSSRDGIRVILVCKTIQDRDNCLNTLITTGSGLKHTYNVNATAVGLDGKPKVIGVREAITTWYTERIKFLSKINTIKVNQLRLDLNKVEAVITVLTDTDKFLKIVRKAKDKSDAVRKVSIAFKLSEDMSAYVVAIPISHLISTETQSVIDKKISIRKEIDDLLLLCSHTPELDKFICSELFTIARLQDPARSEWYATMEEIPSQHAHANQSKSLTAAHGNVRARGVKETRRKRVQGVDGKKPSPGGRRQSSNNAQARDVRGSSCSRAVRS